MKNGDKIKTVKSNKTKEIEEITVQARVKGELKNKFEFLLSDTGLNNSAVVQLAISELAKSKGYTN